MNSLRESFTTEEPPARCRLCRASLAVTSLPVLMTFGLFFTQNPYFVPAFAVAVGLLLAFRRLCPEVGDAPPAQRVRVTADALCILMPERGGWSWIFPGGWHCLRRPRDEVSIPLDQISGIKLAPGYLAVYSHPHHAALDVFFADKHDEAMRAVLAPLAHRFVDEASRLPPEDAR